jgi:hypothetical protein
LHQHYDGKHYSLSFEQTPKLDKVLPETFGYILRLYPLHPEFKSLAPDGTPCGANTRGLLLRMHVVATKPYYIGRETDRKWKHGEDLSLLMFEPAQFDELGKMVNVDQTRGEFSPAYSYPPQANDGIGDRGRERCTPLR